MINILTCKDRSEVAHVDKAEPVKNKHTLSSRNYASYICNSDI